MDLSLRIAMRSRSDLYQTTDSVHSNDKLKEESYTKPKENLQHVVIMNYENGKIINSVEKDFSRLGVCIVCIPHFNYDQRIHEHLLLQYK
ncbi:hypothetical protein Glove_18g38 [Diversispora epigaea]|uniref:Uncharacterized protein n=1 Tax=Diversispora epigaea TaxID=1348612 RepID=A0A397JLH9_9GLOM|nr:hypothetical protein Glove_18g38 [Diversispora epigaea]